MDRKRRVIDLIRGNGTPLLSDVLPFKITFHVAQRVEGLWVRF